MKWLFTVAFPQRTGDTVSVILYAAEDDRSTTIWSPDINCVVRFSYVSLYLPTLGFKFISRRLRFQPAHYARAWTRNSLTALPWSFPHDDCIGSQYQHKEKYDRLSWPPHGMYSSLQNHCIDGLRQGVNWASSVQSMVKILDSCGWNFIDV